MANWKFYAYEVWGRGADSWVNDIFEGPTIELSDNPSNQEILGAIEENIGDKVEIDNGSFADDTVYLDIPVKYKDEETGEDVESVEPYGELRKVVA